MDEPLRSRRELEMKGLEDRAGCAVGAPDILASTTRLIATGLGIVAIVLGLSCSAKVFFAVHGTLTNPEGFDAFFQQWVDTLGGQELEMQIDGRPYPIANLAAILVLGLGTMLLAWIAIGIMLTGAKIVSWTAGDKEAVKRVLDHAFGSRRPPGAGA